MIAGRGLAVDNSIGAELRTGELDGVEMIAQLAEGKIEFPLRGSLANTSETSAAVLPEYSLADYSLRELRYGLAFALEGNITKIEERINTLRATFEANKEKPEHTQETIKFLNLEGYKTSLSFEKRIKALNKTKGKPENLQKTIDYLEEYKKSLTMGGEILRNLTDHIEEPGEREVAFAFRVIEIIHECFSAHAQVLEEFDKSVLGILLKDYRDRTRYLNNKAHALIHLAAELSREQPRDSILADYRQALRIFGQALEELAAGNRNRARYFDGQATARFWATEEEAGANRADIVRGYNEVFALFSQAVEELAAGKDNRALLLANQARACFARTKEEAGAKRAHIIAIYNNVVSFCKKALPFHAMRDYVHCLVNRASSTFEAAEEAAGANRMNITVGFNEAADFYVQAVAAIVAGNDTRVRYLRDLAAIRFSATQEAAGANRASVIAAYNKVFSLREQAFAAWVAGNGGQARDLNFWAFDLYRDIQIATAH